MVATGAGHSAPAVPGSRKGPQAAEQVGEPEGVPAEHVDVVPHERREAGDVLVADVEALDTQPGDGGVHVAGVE